MGLVESSNEAESITAKTSQQPHSSLSFSYNGVNIIEHIIEDIVTIHQTIRRGISRAEIASNRLTHLATSLWQ